MRTSEPTGPRPSVERRTAAALFPAFLIVVAAYAIAGARHWPFKAALFPLATSIPLLALAAVQLVVELRGSGGGSGGRVMDVEFSAEVPPAVARRRTLAIFAWIGSFVLLVALIGFPLTVPLFVFAYLASQRGVSWRLTVGLTAAAWGFFHALFERLLHLHFGAGWVQTWLGL
jgi:hypothetical protein